METEQKQTKILFAGLTILVLAGIFLYSASLLDRNTPVIQSVDPQSLMPTEVEPEVEAVVEPARVSTLDWKKVQFDACGGKDNYSSLPWWGKLDVHVQKLNYYSEGFIASVLKWDAKNDYYNPSGVVRTYEEYCQSSKQSYGNAICQNRKLSMNDFNEYAEGCLSKDGMAFVGVFPAEYMGGGNYVFRYDVKEDAFEVAKITNEAVDGYVWSAPPTQFGKRSGNIIKMSGGTGDAGCGGWTDFDYDLVANTIKLKKSCGACDEEEPVCKSF